jgi:hypothetical protein
VKCRLILKIMADFDYRRNSDYLQFNNTCTTPRNAVLEANFSDTQQSGSGGSANGDSVMTYSAAGGEYSFTDTRLVNAVITLLFRDGINYYQTTGTFTGVDKEFQYDPVAGTVTFPPSPFPALVPGEKINILFTAANDVVIVTEPITTDEAKDWLKVEVSDDDILIGALITAARQACEGYVGMSFVERTITAIVKNELGNVRLPYGPTGFITAMYDVDGNALTDYTVTGVSAKRISAPISSYLQVVYSAGYFMLPKQFKTAVLMQLAWMYQNRGDIELSSSLSSEAELLLKPYRSIV